MKLYKLSRIGEWGDDYYDSFIVSAISGEDAKKIHPDKYVTESKYDSWVKNTDSLEIEYLGETEKERGVILVSYNAW